MSTAFQMNKSNSNKYVPPHLKNNNSGLQPLQPMQPLKPMHSSFSSEHQRPMENKYESKKNQVPPKSGKYVPPGLKQKERVANTSNSFSALKDLDDESKVVKTIGSSKEFPSLSKSNVEVKPTNIGAWGMKNDSIYQPPPPKVVTPIYQAEKKVVENKEIIEAKKELNFHYIPIRLKQPKWDEDDDELKEKNFDDNLDDQEEFNDFQDPFESENEDEENGY